MIIYTNVQIDLSSFPLKKKKGFRTKIDVRMRDINYFSYPNWIKYRKRGR